MTTARPRIGDDVPLSAQQPLIDGGFVALHDALVDAGWSVRAVDGASCRERAEVFAAFRRAFSLPDSVVNLDALADALKDLPEVFSSRKVALVIRNADAAAELQGEVWDEIADILTQAGGWLWRHGADSGGAPLALDVITTTSQADA